MVVEALHCGAILLQKKLLAMKMNQGNLNKQILYMHTQFGVLELHY